VISVEMPRGAVPLSVAAAGGVLLCWAEVAPEEEECEQVQFKIVGTGHLYLQNDALRFLGTAFMGSLVRHVWVEEKATESEVSHA